MFPLQAVIIDVQINVPVNISEENSVECRNKISIGVKHSHVTTSIDSILEPQSFDNQSIVFKFIMQYNSI